MLRFPAAAVDEAGAAGIGEAGEEARCRWTSRGSMSGAAYAAATVAYGSGAAASRGSGYGAGYAAAASRGAGIDGSPMVAVIGLTRQCAGLRAH